MLQEHSIVTETFIVGFSCQSLLITPTKEVWIMTLLTMIATILMSVALH